MTDDAKRPVITTWLIVRHAEAQSNAGSYFAGQSDVPLTDRGIAQAAALARALAHAKIDAVHCSDLSRAMATVQPIATTLGLAVQPTPRLRERDMGTLVGMSFEQVRRDHPALWAALVARDASVKAPGGESHADVATRVGSFLDELQRTHRGQTVLLGSHGVAIHHLVRWALGVRTPEGPAFFLSVENASVTRIDCTELGNGHTAPRLTYANRVVPLGDEPTLP